MVQLDCLAANFLTRRFVAGNLLTVYYHRSQGKTTATLSKESRPWLSAHIPTPYAGILPHSTSNDIVRVMQQQNFKLDKWKKEFKQVEVSVAYLRFNNTDFLNLSKRFNDGRLEPYLWEFARRNYVTYMSMAIRRLLDDHRDVVSLWKLLSDIEANAETVTRKWFLKEWPGGAHESTFLEFFGSGDFVQQSVVAGHKKQLDDATRSIRDRADKFEAHMDKKPKLKNTPTFNDIDNSVVVIAQIYKKYYYLFNQKSLTI